MQPLLEAQGNEVVMLPVVVIVVVVLVCGSSDMCCGRLQAEQALNLNSGGQ